jgi:hypothetical protein
VSLSVRGRGRQPLSFLALALLVALSLILLGVPAGSAENVLIVGAFSNAVEGSLPPGWKPQIFKKKKGAKLTAYTVVRDGNTTVVRAESVGTASGIEHEIPIDLKAYPMLRWRWKVEDVVASGDPRRKDKDDYAARVYVTFAFEPDKASFGERLRFRTTRALSSTVPFAAIAYIWASRTPVGTVVASPHMGDVVKLIVVESGDTYVGQWMAEERNVYEDYRRAFGKDPPRVSGVAIMTDTDNTQERATAYYGDLIFTNKQTGTLFAQ